jgi:HlyD family secretion protein
MKRVIAAVVILLLVAGGVGAYVYLGQARFMAVVHRVFGIKEQNATGEIRVSGNIETTEVQIAFKIPGRVVKRFFDEGDMVQQGAVVALLDTSDLEATVAQRRAALQTAQAALDELKAGSRKEDIAAARAAWEKAAHGLADLEAGSRPQEIAAAEAAAAAALADKERLQSDFRRAAALFERRTISAEEYDAARSAYDVAAEKHRQSVEQLKLTKEGSRKEQIEQSRSALAQAKAQYDLVKAGPRIEDIRQGETRVAEAQAALRLAEVQLGYAEVRSPIAGVVLSKNIEPGEYVAPGTPVITIGDLVHVWLRAYIEESDLGRVAVGQKAVVTNDTWPDRRYEGRVSFISSEAEFTPKNVQTQKERVKLVYRIKIDLTNPADPAMQLKPGMPADAVIIVGQVFNLPKKP